MPDDPVRDVTFSDPPNRPIQYDWAEIAKKLKRRPGKWALIFERDRTSVVNAIRQGNIAAVRPDHGFEVRTANNVARPHRVCSLYLRYVPEMDERIT